MEMFSLSLPTTIIFFLFLLYNLLHVIQTILASYNKATFSIYGIGMFFPRKYVEGSVVVTNYCTE